MKDFLPRPAGNETEAKTPAAAAAGSSALTARIQGSPRLTAQRRQLQDLRPPARGGLPTQLKSGMEALSGLDLSDVRVHLNSSKPAQLKALAYAQGNHIHLGPGQERHLAHEAWHVVQQRQGRVAPTAAVGGTQVNDDGRLEAEADRMGAIAQRMHADDATQGTYRGASATGDVTQLKTQVNYESQNVDYPVDNGTRTEKIGKVMDAYLDPLDPIRGTPTDAKEIDGLMRYLADAYPAGSRGWHRGHLLNAKLGGLNIPSNLAPFTNAMNTGAHSVIEDSVKRLVGIGIPTRYVVTYSLTGNQQAVTPKLTMKVEPVPIDDDQQEDLDIREIPPVQEYTISARTLAFNIHRRPRSPQPAHLGLGDGTSTIPVQDDYSKFQDKRILEKGWGMLEKETRSRTTGLVKRKAAPLDAADRDRVEQAIENEGGRLFGETVLGTQGYTTDFWLHYNRGRRVYTRSNRDTVDEAIHKVSHVREYVALNAGDLITQRLGSAVPFRYELLQHIYTRSDGNEVWHVHDGQLDIGAYLTTTWGGQTVLRDHGQARPERYEWIRKHYTRRNGDQVWEAYDGEGDGLVYLTLDAGGDTILDDHGPSPPSRYQGTLVYIRKNGNKVWFVHDGSNGVSFYETTDPGGNRTLEEHGQAKPGRYESIEKIYTRQNGDEVWKCHDGERHTDVYLTSNGAGTVLQVHGAHLPERYELIQQVQGYAPAQVWSAYDGETGRIVNLRVG